MQRFILKCLINFLLISLFLLGGIGASYGANDLAVTLPVSAVEGDGLLTAAGTVSTSEVLASDLVVYLSSSDASEVTVPTSITILAGQSSAEFDITIIDDTEIDETQTVTINASALDWRSNFKTIQVQDNESMDLIVALPENAGERSGVLANGGTVSISGVYASDLVIELSSDDTTAVTVPATLTIPAGQTSASFDLTIIDDAVVDGTANGNHYRRSGRLDNRQRHH